MVEKSKKHVTRYIREKDGEETIEEKNYTAAPYAEFKRQDTNLLSVSFNYGTSASIPLYYAIFVGLVISIPTIIVLLFLSAEFVIAGIIVMLFLNIILFVPALIIRQIKLSKNFKFIFDKGLNLFTKSKIIANEESKLLVEARVSEIKQIEIKSARYQRTTRHWINIRLNDDKKIKFFFISYPNTRQILEYTLFLCDFLGVKFDLTTPYARRVFTPRR